MAIVWLIRHGESEANVGLPTPEQAKIKLTATGHKQAKQIALYLQEEPSLIVTSRYIRTKQTAQPTIEKFTSTLHVEWEVQEFSYLADKRRKNTTLSQRRPMADKYWQDGNPFYVDGEGAESFAQMMKRIQMLREKITLLDSEFVTIFTHGLFMKAFLWSLLSNPPEINSETMGNVRTFLDLMKVPNGAIMKLQCQNQEILFGGIVTAHLSEYLNTSLPQSKVE